VDEIDLAEVRRKRRAVVNTVKIRWAKHTSGNLLVSCGTVF
jgi:hypothetical protein